MAELEVIQAVVMQSTIQAATVSVMVLREVDARPMLGTCMASVREACRHRHGKPALRQSSFDWKGPNMYKELLNFKMEVTNILQTNRCGLNDEGKVSLIKRMEGTAANTNTYKF